MRSPPKSRIKLDIDLNRDDFMLKLDLSDRCFAEMDPDEFDHRAIQAIATGLFIDFVKSHIDEDIQVLEYPWSDHVYPSITKIWGIDCISEPHVPYFDLVWLWRSHPDSPQDWIVTHVTVLDDTFEYVAFPDGTELQAGNRDYLEKTLELMGWDNEKTARELSAVLKLALKTGQLRYSHLHLNYSSEKSRWFIQKWYEIPIYPVMSNPKIYSNEDQN
jgi:hypothetical protein